MMLPVVTIWAVNLSLVKIALAEIPPLPYNGIRLLLASAVLLTWLLFDVKRTCVSPAGPAQDRSALIFRICPLPVPVHFRHRPDHGLEHGGDLRQYADHDLPAQLVFQARKDQAAGLAGHRPGLCRDLPGHQRPGRRLRPFAAHLERRPAAFCRRLSVGALLGLGPAAFEGLFALEVHRRDHGAGLR